MEAPRPSSPIQDQKQVPPKPQGINEKSWQNLHKIIYNYYAEENQKPQYTTEHIRDIFQASIEKFETLSNLYSTMQANTQSLSDTELKITQQVRTFAFHYLSRGSSLPMPVVDWETGQRSPFDYIEKKSQSQSTYHRGDVLLIRQPIIINYLKSNTSFDVENIYRVGLIKPDKFTPLMKKVCATNHVCHRTIDSLDEIQLDENYKEKYNVIFPDSPKFKLASYTGCSIIFCDISKWIEITWNKQHPIDNLLDEIQSKVKKKLFTFGSSIGEKLIKIDKTVLFFIGGVISIQPEIGIYVFFNQEEVLDKKEMENRIKEDNLDGIQSLVSGFIDLVGHTGSYPEMISMKSALKEVKEVDPLQDFFTSSTNNSTPNNEEDGNSAAQPASSSLAFYLDIIEKLKSAFTRDEKLSYPSSNFTGWIKQSEIALIKAIKQLHASSKFYTQLQFVYLAFEEIIFLSKFYIPQKTSDNLKLQDAIPRLFDDGLFKNNAIECAWVVDSGMACFETIIDSVFTCHREYYVNKKYEEKNIPSPKLGCTSGVYYEVPEAYQFFASAWEFINVNDSLLSEESQDSSNEISCYVDLLILDLYPNDVTLPVMQPNPVETLIDTQLKKDRTEQPLSVVIDVSNALFSDDEIARLYKKFYNTIQEGKLKLIVMSSLAKFYGCGLDKYTGGAIAILGDEKRPFSTDLVRKITVEAGRNIMSNEAKRFYYLMFTYAHEQIKHFYDQIKDVNDKTNRHIQNMEIGKGIVQEKDKKIPVISINNKQDCDKLTKEEVIAIEQELSTKFQKANLPLLVRASFPFPHSAIIECQTAVRLVMGLDAIPLWNQYEAQFNETLKTAEGKSE